MCTLFYLFIYYIYVCLQNVFFLANKTLQCHSVMVDKYKNKSCFDYEWKSYVVLTQNSTYVFTCSLHSFNIYGGARCSSVVRAFTYVTVVSQIDPLWWIHRAISHSSQCSTTGVTNAVVCVILSLLRVCH